MPDSKERRPFWLPFLVLSYIDTIRRATFYAFGWAGQGQALAVMSVLAAMQACAYSVCPSGTRKVVSVSAGLLYAVTLLIMGWLNLAGPSTGFMGLIFGLPRFDLGSISPGYYAAFSFFVVVIYGLMVFLIISFIMERKSMTEIFWAGSLLLVVEVITSDQGIMIYIAANVVISIILRGQLHLYHMESDPRVRFIKGSGFKKAAWGAISALLALVISAVALALPAANVKIDFNTLSSELMSKVIQKQIQVRERTGAFDKFWGRMADFELKGEVKVDNSPVMYVKSPRAAYWRGESADYYTGTGWKNTMSPTAMHSNEFENPYAPKVRVERVEQFFSLAAGVSSQVVFSSGSPALVEIPDGQLSRDEGDNLYTDNIKPGITYRVETYFPIWEKADLKKSVQEYPPFIKDFYLQLPLHVPPRVRQLAEKLTAGAGSPYEKAKVIENYLAQNYPYDLTISPVPNHRDAADYFLFELKRGYCTYHSTAMVVMLRSIGIPARWVKGFVSGTPNGEGIFNVAMSDAHAWVEVYFSGYGWVPFEPTASFVLPEVVPEPEERPVADVPEDVLEVPEAFPAEILRRAERKSSWLAASVAATLAAGALLVWAWRAGKRFSLGSGDRVRDIYHSLIRLLAHKGFPKNAAQTPLEYAAELVKKLPVEYDDIMYITEAYLKDKYGNRELTKEEAEKVHLVFRGLAGKWLKRSRD